MKLAALSWLGALAAAGAYLALRLWTGVEFQTDLMALMPQEERDAAVQHANDRINDVFGRRIVLLVGHADRTTARTAAGILVQALQGSGMTQLITYRIGEEGYRAVGQMFFPHRMGLLSSSDRARLQEGRGQEIMVRALANIYGPIAFGDAILLRQDPFFLLPTYLASLPLPMSRVVNDEGLLSVSDRGKTFVVIEAELNSNVFSLAAEKQFVRTINASERDLRASAPDIELLRVGSIFYAHAGAVTAIQEVSVIGMISTFTIVVVIFIVFRALRPLWFSLLTVSVGIMCAFSVCFWLYGTLHIGALLFGVSLIGVTVDYSLHYCSEGLSSHSGDAWTRLRRVLPGITLGLVTTLIGYLTLLLAPFPGLHELAVFSAVGLLASFITVVLWLPWFDRDQPAPHRSRRFLLAASWLWTFWEEPKYQRTRIVLVGGCVMLAVIGAARFKVDDDVRRLQSLADDLKLQEFSIRQLIGIGAGTQFFLIQGPDEEAVLEKEEQLTQRLESAKQHGVLAQFQAVSQIIPSIARQRENRALVQDRLIIPFLQAYYDQIGISDRKVPEVDERSFLTPAEIPKNSPLSFMRSLILDNKTEGSSHLVLLNSVVKEEELREIARGLDGVRFIDAAGDFSRLFGEYRRRAVELLALSSLTMMPILIWRYGIMGSLRVLFPPAVALILTPALVALGGQPFTFFNAIALVLVLAISIDYAIFCKEAEVGHKSSTMLGISLATLTTILSFGLLALSSVYAVQAFGITLAVGISLAFLLSPLAGFKQAQHRPRASVLDIGDERHSVSSC
jgi:predicted exporter